MKSSERTHEESKKKTIKATGKKIPRILCEVLKAANIAKTAYKNGTTLKHEVIKSGLIKEKEYDKIMNPILMTKPK